MTQNFRTSQLDKLFGTNSIKITFSGATFKELHDNLIKALEYHPDLKMVVCCLNTTSLIKDKDAMWNKLNNPPDYLYDDDLLNDVNYIFNRDVIFTRVYQMAAEKNKEGFEPGITSFNNYANWMSKSSFGYKAVCPKGLAVKKFKDPKQFTDEDREKVTTNVRENLVSLAEQYPDTQFYFFIPPYSCIWWKNNLQTGQIYRHMEAEKAAMQELFPCQNVKVFSFDDQYEVLTDLNNYRDVIHYASWVNSMMLQAMSKDENRLTPENYESFIEKNLEYYSSFNFKSLKKQEDYEDDYFEEGLWNERLNDVEPLELQAEQNEDGSELRIEIESIKNYKYLSFYGVNEGVSCSPSVRIEDADGNVLADLSYTSSKPGSRQHYTLDVKKLKGKVVLVADPGTKKSGDSSAAQYRFEDLILY